MENKRSDFFSGFTRRLMYGAHIDGKGVHFSIFSRNATHVWLLLFNSLNDDDPVNEILLDPVQNRTGDIWHIWVRGVGEGQLYLWRMDRKERNGKKSVNRSGDESGKEMDLDMGHRFDAGIMLIDPYAKAVTGSMDWRYENPNPLIYTAGKGAGKMPKCVVCSDAFDWQGTQPLNRPLSETVIYECHVRGITAGKGANVEYPGTYKGVVEKIPYFKELGITALEFLPVQEFDAIRHQRFNPLTGEPLYNYWGYNTVCFFAPNGRYCSTGTLCSQVSEFKWMVRELHKAGIEVILDIVFNHTSEGGKEGPVFSFKGIDNSIYYMLDPETREYLDYTGCGNTINCNHPVVKDFIISCLYYWVLQMHVDGFRFDLASVLGRDETGNLLANPPLLRRIEEDPILRDTKIIAEAWDAAGAYQVGEFSGRWGEWNGRYRDDVRAFWRGNSDSLGPFATRIAGSSDLFGDDGRTPHHSINFPFSHDGFTLNDWLSYEKKHNMDNGHNNDDGDNWNLSINHGVEGPTDDPTITAVRMRQAKNLIVTLMLSLGVPMILGGDEFLRSQGGNNNPYCQDNDVSWFDWRLVEQNAGMVRFVKEMIGLRMRIPVLRKQSFYTGVATVEDENPDITWFGSNGTLPDWRGSDLALAALVNGNCVECDGSGRGGVDIYMMFNANINVAKFIVPQTPNKGKWRIAVNTFNLEPEDIYNVGNEPLLGRKKYFNLEGRSSALLIAPYGTLV